MTPILFIGGKGGVGKTTISASIASKLAASGKKTLIISTDPAHSLADALDVKLSHKIKNVSANLDALELDPTLITNEHFKNIEETLKTYSKPEMFPKIKQHLELSKDTPGAQEAALLEKVCELITDRKDYDHIVFDTAPTGHTIRLLSMPSIMSAWSEGLMRHQKDREKVAGAAKVFWQKKENYEHNPFAPSKELRWQQALKRLDERKKLFNEANQTLKDPSLTSIYLVMIPQALPLFETLRANETLETFGIKVGGIFINQIIPQAQTDSFWQAQIKKQDEILVKFHSALPNTKKFYVMLSKEDLRGVNKLANLKFEDRL
ncbi:ArsA family ATPase [Campylobacter sp. CCUG 57310]|uniref:ArsA family ATPase n=1 Tax=Campylobacter sp. CCUG 57310 TaxID=2517362 RepID=UPI0015670FC6|nr:ArsA family ATPase [Campylobacter sp. CCUG 57310]QKF92020.1 arsenical pump-driving ATPase [Campylobacter sp. CCUG 57310]